MLIKDPAAAAGALVSLGHPSLEVAPAVPWAFRFSPFVPAGEFGNAGASPLWAFPRASGHSSSSPPFLKITPCCWGHSPGWVGKLLSHSCHPTGSPGTILQPCPLSGWFCRTPPDFGEVGSVRFSWHLHGCAPIPGVTDPAAGSARCPQIPAPEGTGIPFQQGSGDGDTPGVGPGWEGARAPA